MAESFVSSLENIKCRALERFCTEANGIVGESSKEAGEHASELRIYTEDQICGAKKQIF